MIERRLQPAGVSAVLCCRHPAHAGSRTALPGSLPCVTSMVAGGFLGMMLTRPGPNQRQPCHRSAHSYLKIGYYSGSKEFMAESFMAESFFKSLEGDSSLVGLSACGCAQTGVDPMTFSNSEMILPYLSSNEN
ncbi:MAG: hypothetical protein NTW21_28750 [Verrucomicrobia bacterium]|nr:hypothetical protein [Verrucomicrobiota bacterium]